jgi:hypothetical protein
MFGTMMGANPVIDPLFAPNELIMPAMFELAREGSALLHVIKHIQPMVGAGWQSGLCGAPSHIHPFKEPYRTTPVPSFRLGPSAVVRCSQAPRWG